MSMQITLPPCPALAPQERRPKLTEEVATLAAKVDQHLHKMEPVWK